MEKEERQNRQPPGRSHNSIRLTFRIAGGRVELLSHERLQMMTPPQPGERPQIGRHGGFWLEMRDGQGRVVAHRVIDPIQVNSVEVHAPDGKMERRFSETAEALFEVVLPDEDAARTVALIGEPLVRMRGEKAQLSRELAQFSVPGRENGGK